MSEKKNVCDKLELCQLSFFFKNVFFKKRKSLLYTWHAFQPTKGETLREIWKEFITIILYGKVDIVISFEGIFPFGENNRGFCIPIEQMDKKTLNGFKYLYVNRRKLFKKETKYGNSENFVCSSFIHNNEYIFPTLWRRSIILDFCKFVCFEKRLREYQQALHNSVLDTLKSGEAGCGDAFLIALRRGILGLCPLREVLVTEDNFFK